MFGLQHDRARWAARTTMLLVLTLLACAPALRAKDKKGKGKAEEKPKKNILEVLDYSKIVWPNPPAITRIKYLNYFSGEKYKEKKEKKASWKDRLAGMATGETAQDKPRFQLVMPYGLAMNSKGRLYIADRKVKAVFVVNPDTGEFDMIKHGVHARFEAIEGVAVDDSDRVFLSDSEAHRVLVFSPQHKAEASISEGLVDPGGMAIDDENRFLYVADAGLSQVMVYDVDPPYKLLRRIGHGGKDFTITEPGYFAKPTNVAVDREGNVYVADTLNDRIQIFDPDGNFIRMFGKAGDGPGYFARPKGIAIDGDGHVWVADAVQDRVQVFTPEGQLLIWMGGHGILPGQFRSLAGLTIDSNNRVFTSEQYPGRVQIFRYFTDAEAKVERDRREAEDKIKATGRGAGKDAAAAPSQKPVTQ